MIPFSVIHQARPDFFFSFLALVQNWAWHFFPAIHGKVYLEATEEVYIT